MPEASFACRSGVCALNHASVSSAVCASGLNVKPAAIALLLLRRLNPAVSGVVGTHTGMSDQARTFCSRRNPAGTQCSFAPAVVAARTPSNISITVISNPGPAPVKTPNARASAMRMVHSARSRASMNWT